MDEIIEDYKTLENRKNSLLSKKAETSVLLNKLDSDIYAIKQQMKAARLAEIKLHTKCDPKDARGLIHATLLMLIRLKQDGVDFDEDELAVTAALRVYMASNATEEQKREYNKLVGE